MQIFVRNLDGKTKIYHVKSSGTVDDVKAMIQDREGLPSNKLRLLYSGTDLENGRTLADCNIRQDVTLHVLLRLLGGAKKRKKKTYTTPKKIKHEHKEDKLAVLRLYKVDDDSGNVQKLRKECPKCGPGTFMANHVDRHSCGKCGMTASVDQNKAAPAVSREPEIN